VEHLKQLAAREGMTVAQLAIAWVLAQPAVDVVIVGAKNARQLEQSSRAGGLHLSQTTLQEIKRIMREALPIGGPAPEGM
jgi:aryl-alcohol dehydrogenase-like predicted oxidoreductase